MYATVHCHYAHASDALSKHVPECVLISFREAHARDNVFQWCVMHARDADPIAEAWQGCTRPMHMRFFLRIVGLCDADTVFSIRCQDRIHGPTGDACADCVARIRELFPEVTLAMVLSARST